MLRGRRCRNGVAGLDDAVFAKDTLVDEGKEDRDKREQPEVKQEGSSLSKLFSSGENRTAWRLKETELFHGAPKL